MVTVFRTSKLDGAMQGVGHSVLVACGAGISRSTTFAIAALKEAEGVSLLEAARIVRPAHFDGMPHPALWELLCHYYLKERIEHAQVRRALAANRELVLLYWQVGRGILARQSQAAWGAKVVERLAHDLQRAFPELKGSSRRNLQCMHAFASAWPDEIFVQQPAAQIPWFHNCALLDKLADPEERTWYARRAIEHGWSRNILVHQLESDQIGWYREQEKSVSVL